jgi:hypothetical protein
MTTEAVQNGLRKADRRMGGQLRRYSIRAFRIGQWLKMDEIGMSMAERGGFEPPVQFLTVRRFSKPLLSTTQPPLREV